MEALAQRQQELDQAIQSEQAKTILHEDAISSAAFYQRFANAKLSNQSPKTCCSTPSSPESRS